MYNLLVVDDEPYIADGLNILLQEEFDELLDIYVAYNGYEAIKIMDKVRIDIFILDIKMPDINGIELHGMIMKKWPSCKVIFLTAYDNFNYVKTALQNKAVDYILKTSKDEKVISSIQKTIKLIEDEKKDKNILDRINKQLKDAIPQIRSDFLISLINGHVAEERELGIRFEYLNLKLDAAIPVMLLIARKDVQQEQLTENGIYMIKEVIEDYLGSNAKIYSLVNKPNEIVCFIQPEKNEKSYSESWDGVHSFTSGTLEIIQSVCKELFSTSISFALSKKPYMWSEAPMIYTKLTNALNYGFGFNREILINEKYLDSQEQNEAEGLQILGQVNTKISNIEESLDTNDFESYVKTIDSIISEVSENEINSGIGINVFFKIASQIMSYINLYGLWDDIQNNIEIENFTDVNCHKSWDDVKNCFKKAGSLIIEHKYQKTNQEEKNIVFEVNEFIKDNLDRDVSLVAISEHVHFNSFYLSRLYKKQAGKSISEYVTEIRLYTAKMLLRRKNMKIRDIVSALGFSDHAYFTRFFKRHEKITPSEYRETHT